MNKIRVIHFILSAARLNPLMSCIILNEALKCAEIQCDSKLRMAQWTLGTNLSLTWSFKISSRPITLAIHCCKIFLYKLITIIDLYICILSLNLIWQACHHQKVARCFLRTSIGKSRNFSR